MKLLTDIPPREDGVVVLQGVKAYEFKHDPEFNALACDIEDERDLALALGSGNFYPADEADEKRAMEIAEDTGEDDLDDDLASDENAPPIEGKTEPKPKRKYTKRAPTE